MRCRFVFVYPYACATQSYVFVCISVMLVPHLCNLAAKMCPWGEGGEGGIEALLPWLGPGLHSKCQLQA